MSTREKGRKRKTAEELNTEFAEIRHLTVIGHTDSEIMDQLKIPRSTFYYYKQKINEESAQEFRKKNVEDLAGDMDILRDRLTRMLKMAMDKLEEPKNYKIASTLAIAQELAINLFKLESQGLRALDNRRFQTIQKEHLQSNQSNKK